MKKLMLIVLIGASLGSAWGGSVNNVLQTRFLVDMQRLHDIVNSVESKDAFKIGSQGWDINDIAGIARWHNVVGKKPGRYAQSQEPLDQETVRLAAEIVKKYELLKD